jgi:hypothetical protein
MDSQIFKEWLQGSKLIRLRSFLYHWELLERRCLKWARITLLDNLKHKLWSKEGPGVKMSIWLPTSKVKNRPDFLVCRWHATYHWKALDDGYNFALDLISIWGYKQSYGAPKSQESQLWEFQDSQVGDSRQSDIWMPAPWPGIEYTIRGKMVASPKSRSWWVLWVRVCMWLVLTSKVLQLCINQLVL